MIETSTHYENAPIVEAVIDVRVSFASEPSVELFDKFCSSVKELFPHVEDVSFFQMQMSVGEAIGANVEKSGFVGKRLFNTSRSRILQARKDGFTYSHMPPYTSWDTFSGECKKLWALYEMTFGTPSVLRCALRYINKIDTRSTTIDPEQYFGMYLNLPKSWRYQQINAFLYQVQLPQPDISAIASVSQALTEPTKENNVVVLLDIDIFKLFQEGYLQGRDLWAHLEDLRVRKNEIFEGAIQNKARELFQK